MIEQLKSGVIFDVIKPVIDYINNILSTLVPKGEVYLVMLISTIIAYAIKSKNNWGRTSFIAIAIIIYMALRYLGIGL